MHPSNLRMGADGALACRPARGRRANLARLCALLALFGLLAVQGWKQTLADALPPPPPTAPPPAAPADASAAAAASPPGGAAETSAPSLPAQVPNSIFLSPEEEERIRNALVAYEKSKQLKATKAETKANDYLNQLTEPQKDEPAPPPEEPKAYAYPQFFLSSIMYHGASDWAVQINTSRFSSRFPEGDPDLRLLEVDEDKVVVEWRPRQMIHVAESWEQHKNEGKDIYVDLSRGIVTFTLRPNQTFSSYVMRVLEGKVQPVVLNLKPEDNVPADKDDKQDKNAGQAAQKPEGDGNANPFENITTDEMKNDVGVKGLNKTYKRLGLEN